MKPSRKGFKMPIVLGMVQSKGGVGKTTIALNLAAELTRRGKTVTIYDADPAAHAATIAADACLPFKVESLLLEEAEHGAVATWAKTINGTGSDFVIVDAPGSMGAAYGAAIAISELALVPSGATIMDINGAVETVRVIRQHRKASGKKRPDVLVIPSRIDKRTAAGKEAVATLTSLTEPVAPAISYRAAVADSLATGDTVSKDSVSATEFSALADAIITRLGI
jgi:chromosome partitioning protein